MFKTKTGGLRTLLPATTVRSISLFGVALLGGCSSDEDRPAELLATVEVQRAELEAQIDELLVDGLRGTVRPNGFVYAVDVGQLLDYAALRGNRRWYEQVRQVALDNLIVLDDDDEFTRGFVLWRFRPGDGPEERDATGTTEALRIAEGLWHGAQVFDRPQDRELAIEVLHGYARHQGFDQGIWFVQNYFQFASRRFATNSFLIDIDPDLILEVAEATSDPVFVELAERMRQQIESAVSPAGLLYSMIQPEVLTLSPEPGAYFSPNNIDHLGNTLNIAEQCVRSNPDVARRVLDFAVRNLPDGRLFFDASSGRSVSRLRGGTGLWAPMLRLSAALDERDPAIRALSRLLSTRDRDDAMFWIRGERLLAFQAAFEYFDR